MTDQELIAYQDDLISRLYAIIDNYHIQNGRLMTELRELRDKLEPIDD